MSTPIVTQTINSLVASLQSIADLQGKAFHLVTEDELFDRSKMLNFPTAGVVYGGMTKRDPQKATHNIGLSAVLVAHVVVYYPTKVGIGQTSVDAQKPRVLLLLDQIRTGLMDTRAPGGKFWEFVSEAPAAEKNGVVVWMQTWQTPVVVARTG